MTDFLFQLMQLVKQTAPFIWDAYVRQVYVVAIQDLLIVVVAILVLVVLFRFHNPILDRESEYSELNTVFFWVLIILSLIAIFAGSVDAVGRFINPNYYAIQSLIDSIPH